MIFNKAWERVESLIFRLNKGCCGDNEGFWDFLKVAHFFPDLGEVFNFWENFLKIKSVVSERSRLNFSRSRRFFLWSNWRFLIFSMTIFSDHTLTKNQDQNFIFFLLPPFNFFVAESSFKFYFGPSSFSTLSLSTTLFLQKSTSRRLSKIEITLFYSINPSHFL